MQVTSKKLEDNKRIRSRLSGGLKVNTKNLVFTCEDSSTSDSPIKSRLRKASFNLKQFNNIDIRNQKSIKESFEDCYELEEKVGEGGHSVVYKCRSIPEGKLYAVKFTRKNDPENLLSLKQQYRILAALDNESIMKGHFLFLNQKKSTCHLVCQYYNFPNLRQYFIENKCLPMDQNQAGQILKSILYAVFYMHQQKVTHRDLKPDNILYNDETGQIKIIDFQVAKKPRYAHQKVEMWTKAGTPRYRSPQLIKGSYNQLTDLWSIGVIAYEMLTGKFPFTNKYESNMYEQIKNFVPDLSKFSISESAKSFLCKLLKKDPKQRMSAKDSLSHPFILSKSVSTPRSVSNKKLNSSFDMDDFFVNGNGKNNEEEEKDSPKSKFYDQNVKYSFISNIDKDIGIRFCEE